MTDNLIDEYVDIVNKYSDIPEVFTKAGGYHILSTCLGRFFEFVDFKVARPNTWFIASSIPGRMQEWAPGRCSDGPGWT